MSPVTDDIKKTSGNRHEANVEEVEKLRERIAELESQQEIASSGNDFLAVLSHEIRTPLNVIIGLSDLLLNNDPKHEQVKNLKSLLFSAENMMNLVNNILDFNKIKSGRMSDKVDNFNLKETLCDLESSYGLHAEKNNNKLKIRIDEEIPEIIRGDRLKLIQILSNLLNNALKFTQDGHVTLEVRKEDESENKIDLYFSVRDTGAGISDKDIAHIFERFSRTEDSITQRVGGSGLGLFMVDRLLRMMGSKIEVTSELGEGTDFHFVLTLEKPVQKAQEAAKKAEERKFSRCLQVLLAEDMEEHREVLRQYFEKHDQLDFTLVSNGEEALRKIKNETFDILFLDIKMPMVNGHEVVRRIREMDDQYYKDLPVIALTADVFALEENQEHFTDIITKPFKFRELVEKIRQYTDVS